MIVALLLPLDYFSVPIAMATCLSYTDEPQLDLTLERTRCLESGVHVSPRSILIVV